MRFEKAPGLKGQVYVPPRQPAAKRKHRCADCASCQWCADARCSLCLRRKKGKAPRGGAGR